MTCPYLKVCHNPLTFLVDTPGVLHSKTSDYNTSMRMAICNTIPDYTTLPVPVADYLLHHLNKQQNYRC